VHRERQQRLHRLRAVDQRQPFLGRQHQRLDPVLGKHLRGWPAPLRIAGPPQPPLADQRLSQVRELRQVAGGPDRPLAGNHRQQAQAEQLDQAGRQLRPHTRVASG
jgi:hypothetical protein